jgi:alpha-glucosidase
LLAAALAILGGLICHANTAESLTSPDGKIELRVRASPGEALEYDLSYEDKIVLLPSGLDLQTDHGRLGSGMKIVSATRRGSDQTWKPVYGERSLIRDWFNELTLELAHPKSGARLSLVFRAYNEGLALRYEIPTQPGVDKIKIERELTEFRFAGDHLVWATYTAQGAYTNVPLSQVKPGCERPLVTRADTDLYAAIAEARLVDYARMKLTPLQGKSHALISDLSSPVEASLPLQTPWRVVMLARSPGQLLQNNDLILNLNDPCAITNTSWIKPGKVVRDVSLSTAGAKACVDLAARRNLQFVLFDAGWYGPETSETADARAVNLDPARSKGPLDLQEVLRYAEARQIGIILYVNRRALERQMDELFPLYRSWGVKGVKFGFVNVGSQQWTKWLHDAVRKAADHQLMVDVHDEYRPTGFSRTYPNLMTQEGVRGDEEIQQNHQALTTMFTRFLAGAADNTICYFDGRVAANASHTFQLAKMICFYSPWQFIYWYDRPGTGSSEPLNNVIGNEPELEFFERCPTVWEETQVLGGEIGEYVIIARRSGAEWYIGCMNAGQTRTLEVPLGFLKASQSYTARVYSDDPATQTRTRVAISERLVNQDSTLNISVGPQGGQAIRLFPHKPANPISPVIRSSDYSTAAESAKLESENKP